MKSAELPGVKFLPVLLALAGLGSLLITGALGATLVYGAQNDPFVSAVNRLLFGH